MSRQSRIIAPVFSLVLSILFMAFVANAGTTLNHPANPESYSLSDLQGHWEANSIASGAGSPWWYRGRMIIDADGSGSFNFTQNDGQIDSGNGLILGISNDGIMTNSVNASARSVMDAGKTVTVGTATWTGGHPGTPELDIGVKMADTYDSTDFIGSWEINGIATGPGAPWWQRGRNTIGPDGTMTGIVMESNGKPDTISASGIFMPSNGIFTGFGVSARAVMDAHKTVFVTTDIGSPEGTTDIYVGLKMAQSYSLSDLVGTWQLNALTSTSDTGTASWQRGWISIQPDGSFSGPLTFSDGSNGFSTGLLSLTTDGVVTLPADSNFRGVVDAGKTIMVCTDKSTSATWNTWMTILTKMDNPPDCCIKPGDANHDGKVNVGEAVYIVNYVFKGGPAPQCKHEGDANADGKVNVGDAVYIINFVFKGGATPKCGL